MLQSRRLRRPRRLVDGYTDEFKDEVLQMMPNGHTTSSVMERLYRSEPVASPLETHVRELESDLQRVERRCDVLEIVGYFRHIE